MESSLTKKIYPAKWASALLVIGWIVVVVASVQWGMGISSVRFLLGGGILPILFGILLRFEAEASKKRSNVKNEDHAAALTRLSRLTGGLVGAGLVLSLESLVRMISE